MSSLRINLALLKLKYNALKSKGNVMKIIHTGDWHLGKILNGKQFLEDQFIYFRTIIQCLKDVNPVKLWIVGDIYDITYPSKETIHLLKMLFIRLI